MVGIGSKLNNRGLLLVEALVSLGLIGALGLALQYFTASTMTNIKIMRTEAFVKVFTSNIYQLFNSKQICKNTMALLGPIADGDAPGSIKSRDNTADLVTFPLGSLNNNEVTLLSATVANFANVSGSVRFNIALTYRYSTFVPNQDMVKLIPIQGTVDGALNIMSCRAAGQGSNPDDFFIMLGTSTDAINETKTGDLLINGDLTFSGASGVNRLQVTGPTSTPTMLSPTANTILIPSDKSLKENIEPITASNDMGNGMSAYRFNYISSNKKSIGFLAQEVQAKFPNSVTQSAEGRLAVNYNSVLPQLWEYHKKVYSENLELEKRVQQLQNRIRRYK